MHAVNMGDSSSHLARFWGEYGNDGAGFILPWLAMEEAVPPLETLVARLKSAFGSFNDRVRKFYTDYNAGPVYRSPAVLPDYTA